MSELKDYLSFNINTVNEKINIDLLKEHDVLFFHDESIHDSKSLEVIKNSEIIKILATNKKNSFNDMFTEVITLPIHLSDLNSIIENSIIKKKFSKNSSIIIKDYNLDKNEKRLIRKDISILLTEKEVQLLELLLNNKDHPLSKNKILSQVWQYSEDADTHTVETHIYRLRKKIKKKFDDDSFILNNKDGYLL